MTPASILYLFGMLLVLTGERVVGGADPIRYGLSGLGLAPTTQSAIEATAGHGTLDPSQLSGLPPEQQGAVVANRFIPGRAHAREVTAAARVDESAPLELA